MKSDRFDIRVTGYGGQGVILCSYILGKATALFAEYHSTMTQSFGPEARGSACSAQVVIDKNRVLFPYVKKQDILIAMSQEGYMKFARDMNPGGVLVYDNDMVHPGEELAADVKKYGIPASALAVKVVGRAMTSNIVILGFFAATTDRIPRNAIEEAVKSSVPGGTEKMNLLAFETGYEYFKKTYSA